MSRLLGKRTLGDTIGVHVGRVLPIEAKRKRLDLTLQLYHDFGIVLEASEGSSEHLLKYFLSYLPTFQDYLSASAYLGEC